MNSDIKKRRVVLCGSMSCYETMVNIRSELVRAGISAVIPDSDEIFIRETDDEVNAKKRRASLRHIRRVRDPKTYAILVVNMDLYGMKDYIGPNTFAEIAVALTHYKKVYVYQGIPEFYREELEAWAATSLNSDLQPLISAIEVASDTDARQGFLFDY